MKIKTKANLYIIIALTILMSTYVGYTIYVVYERTLERGINMAEQHAITLSIAVAERVSLLSDQADILQRIISNYPDDINERRDWVAKQLETASRNRSELDGVWVVFLANQLDGLDSQFMGNAEKFGDDAGRVQIYAKNGEASFLGAPYSAMERNADILYVVNERKPRVVARLYQSFDLELPIARTGLAILVPIIDPLTEEIYGILGLDIASSFIFAPFYEYEEPVETQFHGVISSIDTTFLNHSLPESIGNKFTDSLNAFQKKEVQWTFDHEFVEPNASPHTHNLIRQGLIPGQPKAISYSFMSVIKLPGESRWAAVYTVKKEDMMEGIVPFRRRSIGGVVVLLTIMAFAISWLIGRVFRSLDRINSMVATIASGEGDLTQRLGLDGSDEIAELSQEFDLFVGNLQITVGDVQRNTTQLDRTSNTLQAEMKDVRDGLASINKGVGELVYEIENNLSQMVIQTNDTVSKVVKDVHYLDAMVATQSSGVTQSSAAIEEMVASINSVNMIAKDVAEQYRGLRLAGEDGREKQVVVRERIRDVVKGSVNLQEANSIIEEIASQTNLLAMNAAIEAAHAGDVGKGFAVVADEIRNLAESAALQSKNISEELSAVHDTISGIETASDESEQAYDEVFVGIEGLSKLISQIEEAMQEQSIGSQEVIKSLRMITQSAHDVKDVATKMKSAGESILIYSKQFADKMAADKETIIYVNDTIQKVMQTTTDLDAVVHKNSIANSAIWELMKKFKV